MLAKKLRLAVITFVAILSTGFSLSCKDREATNAENNSVRKPYESNQEKQNNQTTKRNNNMDFALKSSHEKISGVIWNSFAEGIKKAREEKKYILVDFYTDECTYCQKMEAETYTDKKLIDYLNSKFVSIKVNAESDKKIVFDGKQITERDLAIGFGVEVYPTIFFMMGEKESIGSQPGFIDAKEFYSLATYIASNAFKTKTYEQYLISNKI